MGATGVEFVRDNFLTTRYLRDYLNIFCQLSGLESPAGASQQIQRVHR